MATIARRRLRGGAATVALSGPAAGLLDACAGGGSGAPDQTANGSVGNPFGVKDGDPLEVVVFNGGFGDQYAKDGEQTYVGEFAKAKVSHQGIQKIKTTLQPRFANGTPPDVVDNNGADKMAADGLYADGQLTDLTVLLDAPSYDDPKVKVRDTLQPGVYEAGLFDNKMYLLSYSFGVYGIWYSSSLFKSRGWTYPDTWDGFLALCDTIKKSGLAPWIHQGKYPVYMTWPIMDLVFKNGGLDTAIAIDSLEPNAWQQQPVKDAVEAVYQLVAKGYVYPGAEGLTHLESQTKWTQNQAAFIPCGSWLPNEQKDQTPAGFDMVIRPMPSLSTSDKLPSGALRVAASEPYIVPARAKNKAGGLEFLRIMLSKGAASRFAELTNSLPCVKGGGDKLTGVTIGSENDALKAAGSHIITWKYPTWYTDLDTAVRAATGELMANRAKPADWVRSVQAAADKVAKDDSIKKQKRTS
jgi:N-acetylglucosamine transport system substrate-binding protein